MYPGWFLVENCDREALGLSDGVLVEHLGKYIFLGQTDGSRVMEYADRVLCGICG